MNPPDRIYLDNAATSWPKPESVYKVVDQYQREIGAAAGRGGYQEAVEATRLVDRTRADLAKLLNVLCPDHIVFTSNGTDSLNLVIHGLLQPGDHVVTSVAEHNSVLRPLRTLEISGSIQVTRLPCHALGMVDPDQFRAAARPNTRLFCLVHASNVTGIIQPVFEIGRLARELGVRLLVDAAQTIGHISIDLADMQVDYLAAPSHKGLLGPLGAGILYVDPDAVGELGTIRQGGTGTKSEEDVQPATLPQKYEAGNLNVPAIVGLGAAVRFLLDRGISTISSHEQSLTDQAMRELDEIDGIEICAPMRADRRVGVVSFAVPGLQPHEVASMLDAARRIQVRAGLHCAPLMHRSLGTFQQGGTIRASMGVFNTSRQIDILVKTVRELVAAGMD